jgi:uncharacterized Fe-S radical SAM superfamily protein PflX
MAQYHPAHRATELGELMDRPGREEIRRLRRYATERGLACLDD